MNGCGGYKFSFTPSNRQLVEINFLNFDPIFPESDELQERRVRRLLVGVGSADPSLDVLGS